MTMLVLTQDAWQSFMNDTPRYDSLVACYMLCAMCFVT